MQQIEKLARRLPAAWGISHLVLQLPVWLLTTGAAAAALSSQNCVVPAQLLHPTLCLTADPVLAALQCPGRSMRTRMQMGDRLDSMQGQGPDKSCITSLAASSGLVAAAELLTSLSTFHMPEASSQQSTMRPVEQTPMDVRCLRLQLAQDASGGQSCMGFGELPVCEGSQQPVDSLATPISMQQLTGPCCAAGINPRGFHIVNHSLMEAPAGMTGTCTAAC